MRAWARPDEALATSEEAVDIYRRLANENQGRFAHGLATSLINLCIAFWSTGRQEEALSAGSESVEGGTAAPVAVLLEAARPAETAPLPADMYGLT